MSSSNTGPDAVRLDRAVADARRRREQREKSYRERALKLFPWICAKCGREFSRANVAELTVHHKDHNHDNNPEDGSNWELLCIYCHDNEHSRYLDAQFQQPASPSPQRPGSTYKPFANLNRLLDDKD